MVNDRMKNFFRKSTRLSAESSSNSNNNNSPVSLMAKGDSSKDLSSATTSLSLPREATTSSTSGILSPSSSSSSFSFLLPTSENLTREPPCPGLELLEYGNGDIYDGEVNQKGLRHGSGTCKFSETAEREYPPSLIYTSQPSISSFTGKWFCGQPCIDIQAVIQYLNGDRYCGAVMGFTEELLEEPSILSEYYYSNYTTSSSPNNPVKTPRASVSSSSPSNNSPSAPPKKKKSPFSFSSSSENANETLFGKPSSSDDGLPFIMKHGEGELHYYDGSKYNGSFRRDVREGFGVMIDTKNGTEYYGNWKENEKEGFGTMIFNDGTIYEGDWRGGKQGPKGVLRLPNGDRIVGEWDGNNIKKAIYEKGSIQSVKSKCPTMLLREEVKKSEKNDRTTSFSHVTTPILAKEDLVSPRKWDGLFSIFTNSIDIEKEKYANSATAKCIEEKRNQEGNISPISRKSIQDTLQTYLNDAMKRKLSKITIDNITQISHGDEAPIYGVLSTSTNDHVLARIISKFVNLFNWKYHQSDIKTTVAAKHHIPHALDDFHSFVIYIFEKTCHIIGNDSVSIFGHKKLLYHLKDHILSRIYSTLFTIYKFCYHEQDNMYKFKMLALSSISMRELGVKEGFIPTEEMGLFEPYQDCIKKLRTLSTLFTTAHEKFEILVEVGKELVTAIDFIEEKKRGKISDRGADDMLPAYLYIFIQAQIPNVYSTFKFLLDFMDEKVQTTEQGYRFSVFENAIQYIPMIDSSIRDTNGILVPTFVLEDRLESCLKKLKKEPIEHGEAPRLLWISSIFIVVGSTLSEISQSSNYQPNTSNPVIPVLHTQHRELLRRYSKYAEKILKCVSLSLESTDIDGSEIKQQYSPKEEFEEEWTSLQKKKAEEPIVATKNFNIIVDQIYPSYIYFKMARKLEELIEEH